MRKRNRSIYA